MPLTPAQRKEIIDNPLSTVKIHRLDSVDFNDIYTTDKKPVFYDLASSNGTMLLRDAFGRNIANTFQSAEAYVNAFDNNPGFSDIATINYSEDINPTIKALWEGLYLKITSSSELCKKLKDTGDAILVSSDVAIDFKVPCTKDERIQQFLGVMLMDIREQLNKSNAEAISASYRAKKHIISNTNSAEFKALNARLVDTNNFVEAALETAYHESKLPKPKMPGTFPIPMPSTPPPRDAKMSKVATTATKSLKSLEPLSADMDKEAMATKPLESFVENWKAIKSDIASTFKLEYYFPEYDEGNKKVIVSNRKMDLAGDVTNIPLIEITNTTITQVAKPDKSSSDEMAFLFVQALIARGFDPANSVKVTGGNKESRAALRAELNKAGFNNIEGVKSAPEMFGKDGSSATTFAPKPPVVPVFPSMSTPPSGRSRAVSF